MVIRDSSDIQNLQMSSADEKVRAELPAMASPFDRVAAVVIDYFIILMPFIYLVIAPFQRSMKEAAILDDQWQMSISMLLGALATLVLILFYQVTCVWLWRATPGKLLMGLRVRSIWEGEVISFSHALSRALYWVLSWLFLGVPFLATFSNYMRRPLHDRISDTVVVSVKVEKSVLAPSKKESSLVRGVYWAVATFIFLMVSSIFISNLAKWQSDTEFISALESDGVLCSEVSDAQEEWPLNKDGVEATRLTVAMTLYAAGAISKSCLEGEVESLYTSGENSHILNLARSFVYADHPDRSDMYLVKICADSPNSPECSFSRIISAVSNDDWRAVEGEFASIQTDLEKHKNSNEYMAIWGVRQFLKRENYARAEQFMKFVPEVRALSDFYLPAQTKVLWGLQKIDEAAGIESIAYSSISDDAKLDLASFLCFEQIWSSCEKKNSNSCRQVDQLASEYDDSLTTAKASLAYLRKHECESSDKPEYEKLYKKILNEDVRSLVSSLSTEGTDGFNEILGDPGVDEELAGEVARRMVERTRSLGLIKTILEQWQSARHTLAWEKLGETLFNKYFERKEYIESLQVAEVLISQGKRSAPKAILENAVVAAVRSGQEDRAKSIFKSYAKIHPLPIYSSGRTPASTASEFSEIVEKFLREEK